MTQLQQDWMTYVSVKSRAKIKPILLMQCDSRRWIRDAIMRWMIFDLANNCTSPPAMIVPAKKRGSKHNGSKFCTLTTR